MNPYITRLQTAIRDLHGCESFYISTESVTETFDGRVIWDGEVVVFGLLDHPTAKVCYGWSYEDAGKWHTTTVLALPPVETPNDAVKAAIAAQVKNENKKA